MGLGSFTYNDFYMSKCCEAKITVFAYASKEGMGQVYTCAKCEKKCEIELRTKYV